ncbi:MAG: GyrI-like domain-containing protein [Actinomycetes bacterium]
MTTTYDVRMADLQQQRAAVVHGRVTMERIGQFLGEAFSEVMRAVSAQDLRPTGPPFARYRFVEAGGGPTVAGGGHVELDVEAGFPVSDVLAPAGRVVASTLPGGHVASTVHVGSYTEVGAAYDAAAEFLTDEGYEVAGAPWEVYLDEPGVPQPRTEVFVPCRPLRPRGAYPSDG